VKRATVALIILLLSFTNSQAQQSVQKADPQKLDISSTLSNAGKALNILEDQRLKVQIKHQLPGVFTITKDDARTELESVRDLLGSADELSLRLLNGCGYIGGATNQAALDSEMKTQTDVWRNGRVRNWFDYFKNTTNSVGAILLASAPILASNGLVDKGYTQIAATVGGVFILVTPVSQLFGSNEDAPAQIIKYAELSRSEYDNVFFRETMINKFRDKANQLQVSLHWADTQSSSLKATIQSKLDQVNSPAGSVPDPLYQKQNVVTLIDSLVLFLNAYKDVAKFIGQSTAELISTIDQYNSSYPEFKDRFVSARALATDLNSNFQMIQEHHLKNIVDITDKLSRWKLLSSK
jgi:hypothetical protein